MTHFSSKPNLTQVSGFYNLLHLRFWKKQFHFGYHHHFIILQSGDGETSLLVRCSESCGIARYNQVSVAIGTLQHAFFCSCNQTDGSPFDSLKFFGVKLLFCAFCTKIVLVHACHGRMTETNNKAMLSF